MYEEGIVAVHCSTEGCDNRLIGVWITHSEAAAHARKCAWYTDGFKEICQDCLKAQTQEEEE